MKSLKNEKLFNKINVIDILLLVGILIVGIIVYKVVFESETTVGLGARYVTTTCNLRLDGMPEGSSKYLEIGANVYDNETNVYIGKLVDVSSGDYLTIHTNHETETFVESKMPNQETVYLTIEVSVSDQGADLVTSNNYYIKVGKAISIRSKQFAGGGYITGINRDDL